MKQVYYWVCSLLGLFLFVLGLFDLNETKFGWESTKSLLGLIIIWIVLLYHRQDKLEEKLNKRLL